MFFVSLAAVSASEDNETDVISVDMQDNNASVSTVEVDSVEKSIDSDVQSQEEIDEKENVIDNQDPESCHDKNLNSANGNSQNNELLRASPNSDILGVDVYSWSNLITECEDGSSNINILSDCTSDGKEIVIDSGGMTIDGHGHTLNANGNGRIFNVRSSSDSKTIHNIVFKNIIFKNGYISGTGDTDTGAAVFFGRNVEDVTFDNCTFENNRVNVLGGAVAARTISTTGSYKNFKFINCNFTGNYAYSTSTNKEYYGGAAIFIFKPVDLEIINCTFNNNYHKNKAYGGAVYLAQPNGGKIENCTFKDNYVDNHEGGALGFSSVVAGTTFTVKNCSFIDNEARNSNNGGAIILRGSTSGNIVIDDCTFKGNKAQNGGAIASASTFSENLQITNCTFENNTARAYGGAVYCYKTNNNGRIATISDCKFIENSANTGGGAIYNGAKLITVESSEFIKNTAPNGAGLYIDTYNTAGNTYDIKILSSNFTNNVASTSGSSIFVGTASKYVTIQGCQFNDTNAVFVKGTAAVNENTDIKTPNFNNYMVYVDSDGQISLSGNEFNNNLIKNYGTITTLVTATVCGNDTYYRSLFEFPFDATLLDDNNNLVVSNSFKFTTTTLNNVQTTYSSKIVEDHMEGVQNLIIQYDYYFIDATDAGIPSLVTRPTILNVIPNKGSYTWLQSIIDNMTDGEILELECNVTFDKDYDTSQYNSYRIRGVHFENGMNYNKAISIEGNGYTISGDNQARIFNVDTQTSRALVINNTNFANANVSNNGGALKVSIRNFKITNCNFTNNAAGAGGAIYGDASGLTVENCNFDHNNAFNSGSSIFTSEKGLTVLNSNFTNGHATTGGAVAGTTGDTIVISNSYFADNIADSYGGAVYWHTCSGISIYNSTFEHNQALAGGAVDINDGIGIEIINSTFTDNNATSERGGAVVIWTTKNALVKNCTFTDNHANNAYTGFGGALFTSGSIGTFINNKFENNTATKGGAMYFDQSQNINLTHSSFNRNNATVDGGAVYFVGSYSTIEYSNFTNNSAGGQGGALVFYSYADGHIINSNFADNKALGDGGALVIRGTGEVFNSKFERNTAGGFGGAIKGDESWGYEVRNTEFRENLAYNGGGIYIPNADVLNVVNSSFYYNTATHNGGAIFLIINGTETFVDYNLFEGNAKPTGDGRYTWVRNQYPGDSYVYLNRILLEENRDYLLDANATAISFSTALLTVTIPRDSNKNTNAKVIVTVTDAVNGTVVFTEVIDEEIYFISHPGTVEEILSNLTSERWYNITVQFYDDYYRHKEVNTTVYMNIEDPTAGQFKKLQKLINEFINATKNNPLGEEFVIPYPFTYDPVHDKGQINITSPIIINGMGRMLDADGYCRIFYINSTNVTIKNVVFRNGNVSGAAGNSILNGGGVYLDASGVVLDTCYFYDNDAEYGAGLYINSTASNTQISNSIFNNNNATHNGGAIDCNAPEMNLTNTLFTSNYAGEYGAALCREAGATNGFGYYNTFRQNHAGIAGAALGWIGSQGISIDTYFFYDNTANEKGGAIYVGEGSQNCTIYNSIFEGNRVLNTGGTGGAIDSVAVNLVVNKSSFTSNSATDGGAIHASSTSGNAKIIDTTFTDNRAYNNGGAINIQASSTTLNRTTFTDNRATNDGGALYVGGTGQMNYIYSSNFNNNVAEYGDGGAINWIASAGHILDSNFTFNSAIYGGAVYMGGNSSNSSITRVMFLNNTAVKNGGAIDWNSTGGNLSYTTFKGNVGEYGAALCRESNATSGFGVNNTFIANHATKSGAALGWMHAQGITITNYTFINNTSAETGGAIYIGPESHNCKIISSTFTGNHVTRFDGMN